jgi:molybdopterin converting factor small subunit
MSITVELTYEMSKALGEQRFEVEDARNVRDVLRILQERLAECGGGADNLTRVAAVAVNGVLIHNRRGKRTLLQDGDTVALLKPAAGG